MRIEDFIEGARAGLDAIDVAGTRGVAHLLVDVAERGARVFIVGNGGSAAMASHFQNDLIKGASSPGKPAIRASCLMDNVPLLTAWANDDSWEVALVRELEALADEGDVLVVLSTSGRSSNLLRAAEWARAHGLTVVSMTCRTPNPVGEQSHHWLPVETDSVPLAESLFDLLCHAIAWEAKALRDGEPPRPA
ncbi:MAG: SIS domain-containing protein [Dehalococcoidia bacterium]|nr:SIS domain-containing protein [Dehalococcoidia bacterium]